MDCLQLFIFIFFTVSGNLLLMFFPINEYFQYSIELGFIYNRKIEEYLLITDIYAVFYNQYLSSLLASHYYLFRRMSPVCLAVYCLLLLTPVLTAPTNPPTQIRSSRSQPDQLQQQQAETKIITRIKQNNSEDIKNSDSMIQLLKPIPEVVVQNQVITISGRIPINISSYYMFRNRANPFVIGANQEQLVTVTLAVRNNRTKLFRLYEQQIIIRDVNLYKNQNGNNRDERLFHFQAVFQEEGIFEVVLGLAVFDYGWLRYSSSVLRVFKPYDTSNLANPINNFNIKDSRVTFSKIRPTNFTIQLINNEIILKWLPQAQVTKITLSHAPSTSTTFITTNWKNSLTVPLYSLFSLNQTNLSQSQLNNMNISLTHPSIPQPNKSIAYSLFVVKQVKVCQHHYMYIDKINLKQFQSNFGNKNMINIGDRYQVQGICGDIGSVVIMDPSGDISDVSVWDRNGQKVGDKSEGINNMEIETNRASKENEDGWFRFHFIAQQEGVYILEINHRDGYAILNMPIYVGKAYPFFPDKVDISKSKLFSSSPPPPPNISNLLPNIISSLNIVRRKYNISGLSLDSDLSAVALKHSLDMIDRNYISHVNPEGLNCKGRAQAEGFFWTIGENIAVQQDFQLLRFKLDRSPLHLRNTINPNWGRVGIGLARSQDNMYYLTELYAPPIQNLTDSLLSSVKSQLISVLGKKPPFRLLTQSTIVSQSLQAQLNTVHPMEQGQQSEKQRLKQVIIGWGIRSASLLNISLRQEINNDYFEDLYNNPNVINKTDRNFIAISVSLNKGNLSIFACLY